MCDTNMSNVVYNANGDELNCERFLKVGESIIAINSSVRSQATFRNRTPCQRTCTTHLTEFDRNFTQYMAMAVHDSSKNLEYAALLSMLPCLLL